LKCISANPNPSSNLDPKAQKRFQENEMTSFSGKCPDTVVDNIIVISLAGFQINFF